MKTVERMMFGVYREGVEGAIYVGETKRESENWLKRELQELPEFADLKHVIECKKWNWRK